MIINALLFFSCLCSLISPITPNNQNEKGVERCDNELENFKDCFFSQMREEYQLIPCGSFGGKNGVIDTLMMSFIAPRRASVDEARALHLTVSQKLVDAVRNYKKIEPYVKNRPFDFKSVRILIFFEKNSKFQSDGTISSIDNDYEIYDPNNPSYLIYRIHDPFKSNNKEFLKESREKAIKRNLEAKIENPAIHKATPKERAIDHFCDAFEDQMYKKHKLECWSIGGKMSGEIEEIGVHFKVIRRATQEEARALILDVANSLLDAVKNNKELTPYLAKTPFPLEHIKIFIGFRTKNYGVYWDTTMEDVTLKNGEVSYYQNTPSEVAKKRKVIPIKTPLFAKESFNEAVKIYEQSQQERSNPKFLSLFRKKSNSLSQ